MTQTPQERPEHAHEHRVVVLGPDGAPVGEVVEGGVVDGGVVAVPDGGAAAEGEDSRDITDLVSQPAKVMRIGSMIKQLLDEVRSSPLDEAARSRLKEIHSRSVAELEDGLAPELVAELDRLSLPFGDEATPSEAELRIAQAQLVGWLEGLFHGIQTVLFAQQMAARAQYEEMRRRAAGGGQPMLGMPGPGGHPGQPGPEGDERRGSSGPYL